jgi:hypothetical protein
MNKPVERVCASTVITESKNCTSGTTTGCTDSNTGRSIQIDETVSAIINILHVEIGIEIIIIESADSRSDIDVSLARQLIPKA